MRKSNLTYYDGGANLRRKRRQEAVSSIEDIDEEMSKEGYLELFGLPTGSKMTLNQGCHVIERRLKEMGSTALENETPVDGSCFWLGWKPSY